MGHCIRAIVAASEIADCLQSACPGLPRAVARRNFAIFPVDADFIDSVTEARPPQSTNPLILLTDAFQDLLRELSRFGPLAYIETDYFGGVGGQGAAVYSDGRVMMEPEWSKSGPINRALSGPINRALKMIGVRRGLFEDRFSALGLGEYRDNDDLIDAAAKG